MAISFTIPGRVSGKGRPRFVRATGRTFTPAKTVSMEAQVKHFASEAMRGAQLLEGPLELSVLVYQQYPASWSKKRKGETHFVIGRPDCDNVVKLLSDSCNGIVYRDDAQIARLSFERVYRGEQERCEVTITPLSEARA